MHLAQRNNNAEQRGISWSSIQRMKKRNLKKFKCLKTPQIGEGTRNRRETNNGSLGERSESNIHMMEKMVWHDVNLQNDFLYGEGKKSDIPDENLISSTNQISKKVMVFTAISWYVVTKPFFGNNNGIKVNKENYCRYLHKKLLPAIEKVASHDNWIFAQNRAPSH